MDIEKRRTDLNKTYRATYRKLDSKNNILLELEGINDRINNRISELSALLRQAADDVQKEQIDLMNKFKLYRTKISHLKLKFDAAEEDEWRTLKPEAEDIFDNAERLLVYPSK